MVLPLPNENAPMIASDSGATGSRDTSLYQTLSHRKRSAGPPFGPPPPPPAPPHVPGVPLEPLDVPPPELLPLLAPPELLPPLAPLELPPASPALPPPHATRVPRTTATSLRI